MPYFARHIYISSPEGRAKYDRHTQVGLHVRRPSGDYETVCVPEADVIVQGKFLSEARWVERGLVGGNMLVTGLREGDAYVEVGREGPVGIACLFEPILEEELPLAEPLPVQVDPSLRGHRLRVVDLRPDADPLKSKKLGVVVVGRASGVGKEEELEIPVTGTNLLQAVLRYY